MKGKQSFFNPLHRAIVEGDKEAISQLKNESNYFNKPDEFGFIPLELAEFLGKRNFQVILGRKFLNEFKVQFKDRKRLENITLEDFERYFNLNYCPFLFFETYENLKEVIRNCPYILRNSYLAKDNIIRTSAYKQELESGQSANLSVRWIDDALQYGLFAESNLPRGCYIGEYTGRIRRIDRRKRDYNEYCFHYPTRFWSLKYFVIDALHEGNLMRFINHSISPNLQPLCLVDRGVLHLIFVAKQKIIKGSQLTFDYGKDFWMKKASKRDF